MLAMWLDGAAGGFGLGNLGGLALPILFFVVLYFLMIAPNQKKQKKWQEMLGQLKSGDRVTTNGGNILLEATGSVLRAGGGFGQKRTQRVDVGTW